LVIAIGETGNLVSKTTAGLGDVVLDGIVTPVVNGTGGRLVKLGTSGNDIGRGRKPVSASPTYLLNKIDEFGGCASMDRQSDMWIVIPCTKSTGANKHLVFPSTPMFIHFFFGFKGDRAVSREEIALECCSKEKAQIHTRDKDQCTISVGKLMDVALIYLKRLRYQLLIRVSLGLNDVSKFGPVCWLPNGKSFWVEQEGINESGDGRGGYGAGEQDPLNRKAPKFIDAVQLWAVVTGSEYKVGFIEVKAANRA